MTRKEFIDKLATTLQWDGPALTADAVLAEIWDSMGQINVITLLDDEFDITLEIDELDGIHTIRDILDILASRNIALE